MESQATKRILEELRNGTISVDQAYHELQHSPFEDLGYAKVDHHRRIRRGKLGLTFGSHKTVKLNTCMLSK